MRRSSGCRIVSIASPLGTVLETPLQLDHERARRIDHRPAERSRAVSATMRVPSTLGWMPSDWFSGGDAGDLVEHERHEASRGTRARDRDRPAGTSRRTPDRKFGGASMPASSTAMRRSLRALDDRGEVLLHLVDRQPAQPVVRAELEDQDPHVALLQRPVEPLEAGGRGVAGDAGVDDIPGVAVLRRASPAAAPDTPASRASPRPAVRLSPSATIFGWPDRRGEPAGGGRWRGRWRAVEPARCSRRPRRSPPRTSRHALGRRITQTRTRVRS